MRLLGTREPGDLATFAQAVERGLAARGGLYLPDPVQQFDDAEALLALAWRPRSLEILDRLIGDEIPRPELAALVDDTFSFDAPVRRVGPDLFMLELFHGPTLAFKDFGARFLAAVLELLARRQGGGPRTILTATSGDTGAAVAHAFLDRPGFAVVVLYPKGLVSPYQERQFAALGGNVRAVAVAGTFDDCQRLAKACFEDAPLSAALGLRSANSINVARLLAQTLYYWEGVAAMRRLGATDPPVIAVPSGNFGNLCAGLLAARMGLPVRGFVAATNANDSVPDYLTTGTWRPRPSVATLSNAMDVGAPNNWERITALFGDDLRRLRSALRFGRASDEETLGFLRELDRAGVAACPHTAVAYGVLRARIEAGESGLFLATAHPAKFPQVLERATGRRPAPAPEPSAGRAVSAVEMPVSEGRLKGWLRGELGARR